MNNLKYLAERLECLSLQLKKLQNNYKNISNKNKFYPSPLPTGIAR